MSNIAYHLSPQGLSKCSRDNSRKKIWSGNSIVCHTEKEIFDFLEMDYKYNVLWLLHRNNIVGNRAKEVFMKSNHHFLLRKRKKTLNRITLTCTCCRSKSRSACLRPRNQRKAVYDEIEIVLNYVKGNTCT